MKEKLCFKKYRKYTVLYVIYFLISIFFMWLGLVSKNPIFIFGAVICLFITGCIAAYYLYCYISYRKRAKDMTPCKARISNWNVSGGRSYFPRGCVILEHGGEEYSSPFHFSAEDAKSMVGKEVLYVIIDETLLIYEIL